jgi:hypothetical protein
MFKSGDVKAFFSHIEDLEVIFNPSAETKIILHDSCVLQDPRKINPVYQPDRLVTTQDVIDP